MNNQFYEPDYIREFNQSAADDFGECPTGGRDCYDDSDDYELSCDKCGEPYHRTKASKHVPGLCRSCCPVLQAELDAEAAEESAWEAEQAAKDDGREPW